MTENLSSGSSIAIAGAGNNHKVVDAVGSKTNFSSVKKGHFTVANCDKYRLVTKNASAATTFTALYYYGRRTCSVNINTGTERQIKLTPTLNNFIDGTYGDKLKVKILYPTGSNDFTLAREDDSVACRFSLDNS